MRGRDRLGPVTERFNRSFPVVLTPDVVAGAVRGEKPGLWTAEVPWIGDCAVSGTDFDSIAEELRRTIAQRLGISARDATDIELQWSVDETGRW